MHHTILSVFVFYRTVNPCEDPHFQKAFFDPELCPTDCSRPCKKGAIASGEFIEEQIYK